MQERTDGAFPVHEVSAASPTDQVFDLGFAEVLAEIALDMVDHPHSTVDRHIRAIAGVLPIVVWALDEDLCFTMVFGGGQGRLGLEDDQLVGAPVAVFGELGVQVVQQVIESGTPQAFMATGELEGEEWQYWNLVTPIEGSRRVVAVSLDTTEQYRATRRAEEHDLLNRTVAEALRDSEERFRLLATEAPIGIFVLGADGTLLYANPQVREQTGRDLATLVEHADAVVHPEDRPAFRQAMRRLYDEREPLVGEYRSLLPDGSVRWLRIRASLLLDEQGEPAGAVGSSADITDHRFAEQQVQEREERLRAIVETAAEGIVSTDETGTIVEFNAAAEQIFRCDSDQVIGRLHFADLLAPELREQVRADFARFLDGAPPTMVGKGAREMPGVRADGTPVPLEVAVTEVMTGEGRLFTGVLRDISERLEFERRLEHLATHDPTTGLANRVFFTAQLEDALARSGRTGGAVAVLYIEIERFAQVVESLGHDTGEELIRLAAIRIEQAVELPGGFTTLARVASNEFTMFVEDLDDVTDTVEFAAAIIEALNEPFEIGGDEAFVDAVVGIAVESDTVIDAEALIGNAALAMGRARQVSATRYEVFDAEMRGVVEHRRRTELALRRGIEREEFLLYYQPVIRIDDAALCGVEALLRWDHPDQGVVPPGEFVPIAEDSGLIVPIGEWVLAEACRQLAAWQLDPGTPTLSVSINLSARQLAEPRLADIVHDALERTGAEPASVTFELTETMLLADTDLALRTLTALKETGVRVALDDFGTGYSSLTYLVQFPIDVLKVDQSFVGQLGGSSRGTSIVSSVVSLARTLGLDVVAEGVETVEQAEQLRRLGCTYAQGFLYSRPKAARELEQLIAQGRVVVVG